ncbi:hypothetical protein E2562_005635 [Oryza meyeriana var. granulata]|uniref:Uncharacterized protein n=1 Tax=Oryza meyeriana var. granulata TaxID=110450 RepID=A0A6G1BJ12_9ORYZ|nr:hypothetical protein E2562_005635 [Oryza meyeriana var. granulata]
MWQSTSKKGAVVTIVPDVSLRGDFLGMHQMLCDDASQQDEFESLEACGRTGKATTDDGGPVQMLEAALRSGAPMASDGVPLCARSGEKRKGEETPASEGEADSDAAGPVER